MRLIDADVIAKQLGITNMDYFICACKNHDFCGRDADFENSCVAIKDTPTIDAIPVKYGKWNPGKEISRTMLGDETLAIEYDAFYCSACGRRYKEYVLIYNYCPNCGAKMDGERE